MYLTAESVTIDVCIVQQLASSTRQIAVQSNLICATLDSNLNTVVLVLDK